VLLIPFTRDPSDCSVSLSNVNRAISTLAPSTAHRLQLHSLGSGFWLVYAGLYRRKKNVGHALRSIVHRLLLRLRTRMLLCISAAIWRCQVSTQSHDMAFRVVGHPNVTKRARTTVLATMVCCRYGLEIRFTSASRPSMTIFPISGGPKGEKSWQRPSVLPKREMGFTLADFVCCNDISTCLDWKGYSGTLQDPNRDGILAKPAHPVESTAHRDRISTLRPVASPDYSRLLNDHRRECPLTNRVRFWRFSVRQRSFGKNFLPSRKMVGLLGYDDTCRVDSSLLVTCHSCDRMLQVSGCDNGIIIRHKW
jgi:hypothetical protein